MNSWPTFVVVAPNGKVLAQISGEGHRKVLMDIFPKDETQVLSRVLIFSCISYLFLHALTLQKIFKCILKS